MAGGVGFMTSSADAGDTASTSAVHLWLLLWKASRVVAQAAARSVAGLAMGLSDFAVLELLLHKGSQPVNVIGNKVLLTSGSITTAIDRLQARKLVKRLPHPEDRRARLVALTEKGRRVAEDAFERHAADLERAMAVLNARERSQLGALLKKLGIFAAASIGVEER